MRHRAANRLHGAPIDGNGAPAFKPLKGQFFVAARKVTQALKHDKCPRFGVLFERPKKKAPALSRKCLI
jgi:hypothetical protein